ncbi:MAG: acyl-CoA transferase [Porticoccaceae bacterium]|nr:acyl-CoA transferase [Porticoccaceae bacterium]
MKRCIPSWRKSRSASFVLLASLIMLACSELIRAGVEPSYGLEINADVPGYLARIEQNDPEEVKRALLKAEQYYLDNNMNPASPVIAFVLHGPEVEIFFRDNYRRYKPIVDLAARLSALKVVDIKVCRTRLRFLETDVAELFPFVGSVPFGPAEIDRLSGEEGFVYF